MIIFKDWTLSGPMEVIARQYDNLSRVLLVTGDLPEGYTWDMLVQVGRAMDIIHLYPMEGGVGAVLTEDQLSQSGYYQMQLRGIQGGVVRHTNVIQALIPPSLSGSGQWPTVPSEFSQMEARMREIVAHPPIPGDNGCWQLWDPDTGEYAESEFPLPEGAHGQDGITPTIGDNGNWYLGDTDTGKPSRGEMGGGGIKTVVVKGVWDETMGKIVYTPNMTYEEARDMMLNLEPFNVILIPADKPMYKFSSEVKYDYNNNRIVLSGLGGRAFYWTADGITPHIE